jgi:hypothetical protein
MITDVMIEKEKAYKLLHYTLTGEINTHMALVDELIHHINSNPLFHKEYSRIKTKSVKPNNEGFEKTFEFKKQVFIEILEHHYKEQIGYNTFKRIKERIGELQSRRNYCAHSTIVPPEEGVYKTDLSHIFLSMTGKPTIKHTLIEHKEYMDDIRSILAFSSMLNQGI